MKLFTLLGLSLSLVLVGAGCAPTQNANNVQLPPVEQVMEKEGDAMMEKKNDEGVMMEKKDDGAMMAEYGSYEVYAPEKLAKAENGDVVLFFRASWCPMCRALDADIRANMKKIPATLTILDVDYDASTELKKKYGVTYQHTMVQVDTDGNLIAKWSGSPTLVEFVKEVK